MPPSHLETRAFDQPFGRAWSLALIGVLVIVTLSGCGSSVTEADQSAGSAEPDSFLKLPSDLPLGRTILAIAAATLISEDLACLSAGVLSSKGSIPYWAALFGGFLGIYAGDVGLYALGRLGGIGLLRRRPIRWLVKEQMVLQAEELFRAHGAKLIFSSRLLPGSRLPVYAAAGVLSYPVGRFCLFMALAGGLSAIVLVTLAHLLGDDLIRWLQERERFAIPAAVLAILVLWVGTKAFEILSTRRNRLSFLARWRRRAPWLFPKRLR